MGIRSIGYIGFTSPTADEWRTFGPDILGAPLAPSGEDGAIRLQLDQRHHRIAIHPGELHDLAYIGWQLPDRLDFEAFIVHLNAAAYPYQMATPSELADRKVTGMASFLDPAGFRHEIFYGQEVVGTLFKPSRAIEGFVADELGGIGHVVLSVPELTPAFSIFATEILGLRLFSPLVMPMPDGSSLQIEFFRAESPRSHCLAYIPGRGMRGVSHIYLEVKSLDDVGCTYDVVRDSAYPVSIELGRFIPDHDVSFYIRSPAGFDIQYATGGDRIDEASFVTTSVNVTRSRVWGHKMLITEPNPTMRPMSDGELAGRPRYP